VCEGEESVDLRRTGKGDGGNVGYTRCMRFGIMLDLMFLLVAVVIRFSNEEIVDGFVILYN